MSITIHVLRFIGETPLLQANPASMGSTGEVGIKSATKQKAAPDKEAEPLLYREADGSYYHPAWALRRSLERGGTGRKLGKRALPGLIRAGVFPAEEHVALLDGDGQPATHWETHSTTAVIPSTRGRIFVHRPMWWPWTILAPFEIDDDFITADQTLQAFEIAGRIAGLGVWRPEKSGRFGRYRAELA